MSNLRAIPAHPYEGAFYYFLAAGKAHDQSHPYYRVLYGAEPANLQVRAAALSCLFHDIVLAPADAHLPDSGQYLSGRNYYHPDLRIAQNYSQNEWAPENRAIAEASLHDTSLRQLLAEQPFLGNDAELQRHFLCRAALQIRLAAQSDATLIGDAFFREVYTHVAPWVSSLLGTDRDAAEPSQLALSEQTLEVVGLNFAPGDLDAFGAIRVSRAIDRYTDGFCNALLTAGTSPNLEQTLLDLMAQAMHSKEVAERVAGAFHTAGSIMNFVGFIPIIGSVASIVGAGADLAAKKMERRAAAHGWYLVGTKFKEVPLQELLRKRTSPGTKRK
jgi:hypothetical protein